jgi:hypothetical protein
VDTIIDLLEQAVAKHGQRQVLIIKPGFRTRIWSYKGIGDQVPPSPCGGQRIGA